VDEVKKRLISRKLGRYGVSALLLIMTLAFITTSSAQAVNLLSLEEMRFIKGGDGFCDEGTCTGAIPFHCRDMPCKDDHDNKWDGIHRTCVSQAGQTPCIEKFQHCGDWRFFALGDCPTGEHFDYGRAGWVCP
jgi:hypothetical protein